MADCCEDSIPDGGADGAHTATRGGDGGAPGRRLGEIPHRLPIRVDGETVADLGMPFFELGIGLKVHF